MSKQWSEELRQRMEQYEMEAPKALFDDIMSAMPATQTPAPQARIVPLWVRRTAVAAMVAVAVAAGYILLDVEEPTVGEAMLALNTPSMVESQPEPVAEEVSEREVVESALAMKKAFTTLPITADAPTATIDDSPRTTSLEQSATTVEERPSAPQKTETPQKASTPQKSEVRQRTAEPTSRSIFQATPTKRRSTRGLMASLQASGLPIGQSNHSSQSVFVVNSVLQGVRADYSEGSTDFVTYDNEHTITTDLHHHLPVRVGALLRFNITDSWAIESGVTYTKLSSETTIGDKANYFDERTSLHYVGIPLNAVYNIWQSNRFTFYVSGGGMVEKSIAGSSRTNYFIDGEKTNSQRSDVKVKELQWSINAAAGAQFNLWPAVAIYAEPSVGYRFANGTKIETLYNERPLDFSLNIGLRFTLR